METEEKLIFTNLFGSVSNKRIILNYKSGTEDIPVGQITSVSFKHKRNYFFAIVGYAFGIVLLGFMFFNINNLTGVEVLIIVILYVIALISGLANWIGHHNILVKTTGQNIKALKVEIAKTKEGRKYVEAVKEVVFK
jgi:hypothetical protein